jgi:phytoene dehydrogenase-like protein
MTERTGQDASADVVVVGGGHNALTCAAYLAAAGLQVLVLEARDLVGGSTITEELTLPGWNHDSCSSAHVVLQSNPLVRDDELGLLSTYGLRYLRADPAVVLPHADGALVVHRDLDATADAVARHSARDAAALVRMVTEWEGGLARGHAHFSAGLPLPDGGQAYEALRRRTAWDVVHETFEHPVVRQAVLWLAFATFQPPRRPGTGALPAAILTGRLRHGWTTPVGGSGALPAALVAHLEDHGGRVVTGATVERLVVEHGRTTAVRTTDGREFGARRGVISAAHLARLPEMLGDAATDAHRDAAAAWQPGLPLFAVHLALREDVTYRTAQGPLHAVAGGIGSPEGLARQVEGVPDGRLEEDDPWLLMVSSTVVDPDRAPGGVFKLLTTAPQLREGRPWSDTQADAYAARLVELAARHVDGLDPSDVLAVRPESPTSLAGRNISNLGGSCHGGEFRLRGGEVVPGWTDLRGGIEGLYLTGSTSHPGGSVSGRPGRNTARVVLGDLGIDSTGLMPAP